MVCAEPRRLPVAIFLMKRGTSMWVGQAAVHGASKQYRQRFASASRGLRIERRMEVRETFEIARNHLRAPYRSGGARRSGSYRAAG